MNFLTALFAVVGFVSGVISIYNLTNSLPHTTKRKNSIFGLVLAVIFLAAFVISRVVPPSGITGTSTQLNTPRNSITQTANVIPTSAITPALTNTPTPSPTPTLQPTPSPTQGIKPGEVLYTADFNHKASDWSLDNNWFISNGELIGKSADSQALLNVPIPTTDYTVKASIIITQPGTFGVVARYQSSSQGDAVVLAWVTNTYIALSTCPSDSCAGSTSDRIPFEQTNRVYNLSITCKGIHITVLGEGHLITVDDTSNTPAAGNVALFNSGMGVEVLSLQIIAA